MVARKETSARRPHMMVGGDTTFIVRNAITLFLYTIRVVSNRDIYSEGNGMCTRRSRMPAFLHQPGRKKIAHNERMQTRGRGPPKRA